MQKFLPLMFIAALLSACGGGGGSSAPSTTAPPPASGPALTFTPAKVNTTVQAGASATINLSAVVNRPADFNSASKVFALIVDERGVLLPGVQLVQDSATQYHAALQTAPTLAAGSYQGNFTVKLCQDSGCASQFPGSPMSLPYDVEVTPAGAPAFSASTAMPLNSTVHQGSNLPAAAIAVQADGRSWTASADAAWVSLSPASGNGSGTLTVNYNTASLAAGNSSATITLVANDDQRATVPVTLSVLPVGFVIDSSGVAFTAVNGAPIPSQNISFRLDNSAVQGWSAASDSVWLSATPTSGTTPSSTVLSANPANGLLRSGNYSGNILFSSPGAASSYLNVKLNLIAPTLQSSASTITLGGQYGRDFSSSPDWNLSLNTSTNAWPWAVTAPPAWLSLSSSSGTVSQSGTSITFTAVPASASVGTTSQTLTATAAVNGNFANASTLVTINKDQHKLIPSTTAVALVGTPGWANISRTVTVTDNYGQAATWSAASDQSWLSVVAGASSLTMTVDPSTLALDSLNTANITITPTDPDVTAPEPIRVAFWKGTTTPPASVALPLSYTTIVADPVRPLLYAHNGGAFIDVYHLYTGLKQATISGFSAALGDMAISPNGDRLYVVDINNRNLSGVDLGSRTIATRWTLPNAASKTTRLRAIRPNGVELVVLNDGSTWLAASGSRLPAIALPGGSMDAPGDGKHLFLQNEGQSSIGLTTFSVDYAALAGGTLFAAKQTVGTHAGSGSLGQDLAASPDGTRVFSASSTPAACAVLNAADLSTISYLGTNNTAPNNVEVGSDGRIYCGVAGRSNATDVWVYSAAGTLLQQLKFVAAGQALLPRQMAVSGDGFLLIGLTDAGTISVVPVGP